MAPLNSPLSDKEDVPELSLFVDASQIRRLEVYQKNTGWTVV
jgi:hypothetical protein